MSAGVRDPKESMGLGGAGTWVAKCEDTLSSFIVIHERPMVTFTAGSFIGTGDSAHSQEGSAARLISSSVKWGDSSTICLMP